MPVPKMPVRAWVQIGFLLVTLIVALGFSWALWRRGEHLPAMMVSVGSAGVLQVYSAWMRIRNASQG